MCAIHRSMKARWQCCICAATCSAVGYDDWLSNDLWFMCLSGNAVESPAREPALPIHRFPCPLTLNGKGRGQIIATSVTVGVWAPSYVLVASQSILTHHPAPYYNKQPHRLSQSSSLASMFCNSLIVIQTKRLNRSNESQQTKFDRASAEATASANPGDAPVPDS
jgi:hypothetical protein